MKYYFFIIFTFLQGCALGPVFKEAPKAPESMALVYLMRGDVLYGGAYPVDFKVNDHEVVSLYDFGYSWIHLEPGDYIFNANSSRLKKTIVSGEVYYIEYHQDVSYSKSNNPTFENTLLSYDENEISEKIKKSRYQASIPLSKANISIYREFKDLNYDSMSMISFLKTNPLSLPSDSFSFVLFDDNDCSGGYQEFRGNKMNGEYSNIEAGVLHTIRATSSYTNYPYTFDCKITVSFTPKEGRKYTINLDAYPNDDVGYFGSCSITINDDTTDELVEFIPRPQPENFWGTSLLCDSDDLKKPTLKKEFVVLKRCLKKNTGC
ncbi:DUF2846 domain-containing protein [Enterovibrio norvegicus]|uniref:DUF2846 domain-containing protein n=1 Tax=Enterovibrio norvegicus TaxID=188144 RepID=UPI001055045B|nr:DUF2846 domain-containing protein [Enterovibrio norvegicus]MCC4798742.1 DUF2846 domain-containing protein [Enterovibrio norvegicus]TKF14676.1 DUF2846 domain-containing protein [Enterovibrio norvegicus]